LGNLSRSIMELDQSFYLPNNIFVKSDTAAMKFGFECRAPFLDNKLVHYSKSLRSVDLLTKSGGKKILKTIAHKLIPVELLKRPKAGFTPPLKGWLEGGLNDWSISLLNESLKYEELSFLHSKVISDIKSLQSKNVEDPYQIWRLLVLINWFLNVNWVFKK
jgi:asparagine synthase (glutamine-hydrolysing)